MAKRKIPLAKCISYHKKQIKKRIKIPPKGGPHLDEMARNYCRIYQIANCLKDDGTTNKHSADCSSLQFALLDLTRAQDKLKALIEI